MDSSRDRRCSIKGRHLSFPRLVVAASPLTFSWVCRRAFCPPGHYANMLQTPSVSSPQLLHYLSRFHRRRRHLNTCFIVIGSATSPDAACVKNVGVWNGVWGLTRSRFSSCGIVGQPASKSSSDVNATTRVKSSPSLLSCDYFFWRNDASISSMLLRILVLRCRRLNAYSS